MLNLLVILSVVLPIGQVIHVPGRHCAEGTNTCVLLFVGEGGALCVAVLGSDIRPKHGCDVTALTWCDGDSILFSTSSVYGLPGIYRYKLSTQKEQTICPVARARRRLSGREGLS